MKKLISVLLAGLLVAAMGGCSGTDGSTASAGEKLQVGVVQIMEHTSLDTIRESFLQQMEQLGYLTAVQLGTRLCGLADDALFDDENSIAAALYQESADLGNLDGKRGLAICYQYGDGVTQSDEKAFALNLELAQANYGAGVYYEVADAYTDGRGTARNPEQAIYWWNRYLETGSTTFIDPDKVRAKIAELEGTS